jgi:hypothetical protein
MNANIHDYRIVWQKWSDPLGEDDLDLIPEEETNTSDDVSGIFYDDEGNAIDVDPASEGMEFFKKPTKVIVTPMGIIPYIDNTASNKIFNFWIGHTNFDLNNGICKLIELHRGIETLDIFTRYRFRIGIGKLFEGGDIMSSISEEINEYLSRD